MYVLHVTGIIKACIEMCYKHCMESGAVALFNLNSQKQRGFLKFKKTLGTNLLKCKKVL